MLARWTPLFALLAGVANVLAFAPFNIWPVQILTLAWLFRQISRTDSLRRNALTGWLYGFGWAACGVHWLYISMHDYGGMAGWMAALAVGLLAAYLGLYAALTATLASWLRQRWAASQVVVVLLLLPALWALSEWLRGWLFTGRCRCRRPGSRTGCDGWGPRTPGHRDGCSTRPGWLRV